MIETVIKNNYLEMKDIFDSFVADTDNISKISMASQIMSDAYKNGATVFSCGNGGSLCDATHFAEELSARFRNNRKPLAAVAINDPAYITCVGNDFGFDDIFARYVEGFGKNADVLLAISTSGSSRNVVLAAQAAKAKGMKVVSLVGKGNSILGQYSDVEISTPPSKYSDRVQEIHIKVIHTLVQLIEGSLGLDTGSK